MTDLIDINVTIIFCIICGFLATICFLKDICESDICQKSFDIRKIEKKPRINMYKHLEQML